MLVNENVIEQLCVDAGSTRTQKTKSTCNTKLYMIISNYKKIKKNQ